MPNAFINSAREKRHLRPPVWREKSRVFHYKDHEVNDVISALSYQSSVPLELKKSYRGNMEVAASNEFLTAQQALQAAKERARSKKSSTIPTRQIEIVLGNGEGRATGEFKVIWWPDLFSDNKHGKLTLQIYYFFLKWYFDLATTMFLKHFQRCVIHSLVDLLGNNISGLSP